MSLFRIGDMVQDEKGERMSIIGGPNPSKNGKIEYTVFRSKTSCSATRLQEQLTAIKENNTESNEYDEAASIATMLRMFNSGAPMSSIMAHTTRQLQKGKKK